MPRKQTNAQKLFALCESKCQALGYDLCDAGFEKEPSGVYLRLYIDKDEGSISLDDCEKVHREIQPLVESFDYDFMEVCSPGIDRPLKREKDILKNIGNAVEVHLYKAENKVKTFCGILEAMDKTEVRILEGDRPHRFDAANVSQVRLLPDLSGLDEDVPADAETLDIETMEEADETAAIVGDNDYGSEE